MRMNITLIGMPGSGKSFIGAKLAAQLGFSLVETDAMLEKNFAMPLQKIVETLGDHEFLDKEMQMVISGTAGRNDTVISPGGSVIYRQTAMKHLKNISRIFYLRVPLAVLEERIGGKPRGIVVAENRTFADLYAERLPLYEKFADEIIAGDADTDYIVASIISSFSLHHDETKEPSDTEHSTV